MLRLWIGWMGSHMAFGDAKSLPLFQQSTAEIRKGRVQHRSHSQWRWHLDEVFVRVNGETHYLWRAVDHEGEVPEVLSRNAGIAELRSSS